MAADVELVSAADTAAARTAAVAVFLGYATGPLVWGWGAFFTVFCACLLSVGSMLAGVAHTIGWLWVASISVGCGLAAVAVMTLHAAVATYRAPRRPDTLLYCLRAAEATAAMVLREVPCGVRVRHFGAWRRKRGAGTRLGRVVLERETRDGRRLTAGPGLPAPVRLGRRRSRPRDVPTSHQLVDPGSAWSLSRQQG